MLKRDGQKQHDSRRPVILAETKRQMLESIKNSLSHVRKNDGDDACARPDNDRECYNKEAMAQIRHQLEQFAVALDSDSSTTPRHDPQQAPSSATCVAMGLPNGPVNANEYASSRGATREPSTERWYSRVSTNGVSTLPVPRHQRIPVPADASPPDRPEESLSFILRPGRLSPSAAAGVSQAAAKHLSPTRSTAAVLQQTNALLSSQRASGTARAGPVVAFHQQLSPVDRKRAASPLYRQDRGDQDLDEDGDSKCRSWNGGMAASPSGSSAFHLLAHSSSDSSLGLPPPPYAQSSSGKRGGQGQQSQAGKLRVDISASRTPCAMDCRSASPSGRSPIQPPSRILSPEASVTSSSSAGFVFSPAMRDSAMDLVVNGATRRPGGDVTSHTAAPPRFAALDRGVLPAIHIHFGAPPPPWPQGSAVEAALSRPPLWSCLPPPPAGADSGRSSPAAFIRSPSLSPLSHATTPELSPCSLASTASSGSEAADSALPPPPPYPGTSRLLCIVDASEEFNSPVEAVDIVSIGDRLEVMSNGDYGAVRCESPIPERKPEARRKDCERRETRVQHYSPQAFKFYMEQHMENVLKQQRERLRRRVQLENEMDRVALCDVAKAEMRLMLRQKESNFLRMRRAKMERSMFDKVKVLGVGAFGEVSLVRRRDSARQLYAMKTLRKADVLRRNQVAHVKAERDILAEADCDWVVKLYYSFQDESSLYFIMEYIPGGDMMSLLIKFGIFEESLACFYIAELVLAIESVHRMGFIHRDIKPDNVLVDKDGHVKLTDFGLCTGFRWTHNSKYYQKGSGAHARQDSMEVCGTYDATPQAVCSSDCKGAEGCSSRCSAAELLKPLERRRRRERLHRLAHSLVGTPNYIAPEVLLRSGYTSNCDWWSVGVILYEMLVGHPPFLANSSAETQYKVINWERTLHIPSEVSLTGSAADLIRKLCCSSDTRLGRNGADEVKRHPFFKPITFEGLRKQRAPYKPRIIHETDTSNFDPVEESVAQNKPCDDEDMKNGKYPEHVFVEFTFRRFFDDCGHPLRVDSAGDGAAVATEGHPENGVNCWPTTKSSCRGEGVSSPPVYSSPEDSTSSSGDDMDEGEDDYGDDMDEGVSSSSPLSLYSDDQVAMAARRSVTAPSDALQPEVSRKKLSLQAVPRKMLADSPVYV